MSVAGTVRLIAAILVIAAAGAAPQAAGDDAADDTGEREGPPTEQVVLREGTFKLELAADPASREKGLMGRKTVDEHGGMLFVFPDVRRRSFWMKNCLVNIDLVYLDRDGRIVTTHAMKVEPPRHPNESEARYERRLRSYVSLRPARFAIELKAGTIQRLKLRVGEVIELDRERLVEVARHHDQWAALCERGAGRAVCASGGDGKKRR